MSLSLLAAVTVAMGTVSFAVPTQAVAATNDSVATAVSPDVLPGYYYKVFYFNYYPPQWYYDEETEFSGSLKRVFTYSDGTYAGEYYGTDPYSY